LVVLVTSSDPLELLTTAQAYNEITRRIASEKVRLLITRFEKGRRLSASLDEHLERVGLGHVGRLNIKLPRCEDYKRAVLHGWHEIPDGQKREAVHLLSSEILKLANRNA
jgi:hypothetical protein